MPHRLKLATVAVWLLALVVALGAQGSRAGEPSLMLSVNLNGALEVVLGNGTRIRSAGAPGVVIPPGPYLLIVNSDVPDSRDVFHLFHLTGAGVSVSSDLLPCENPREIYTVTLRPGSTYTYEDSRHPELARVVFSTASDGSSADTSGSADSHSTGKYAGSVSNSSAVGSAVRTVPFRGALRGTVAATGKLSLSRNGKRVRSLRAGRYRISVVDRSHERGFALARPNGKLVGLTGSAFVGKRTLTVQLKPGTWRLSPAAAPFTVVA